MTDYDLTPTAAELNEFLDFNSAVVALARSFAAGDEGWVTAILSGYGNLQPIVAGLASRVNALGMLAFGADPWSGALDEYRTPQPGPDSELSPADAANVMRHDRLASSLVHALFRQDVDELATVIDAATQEDLAGMAGVLTGRLDALGRLAYGGDWPQALARWSPTDVVPSYWHGDEAGT